MTDSQTFPQRWPPVDPDNIQLYSMNTPNGKKVAIALEEMDLDYDSHLIHIGRGDQKDPDFLRLSPGGKVPVIADPHGPEDQLTVVMESVVILIYLADKSGMLLPNNYRERMDHYQWLVFQAAQIGPMFGQFGHFFKFARDRTQDDYALNRYTKETRRFLAVLEKRLNRRDYLMDEYSIVDIATAPWVETLKGFYQAGDHLQLADFPQVLDWLDRVMTRPAYAAGSRVCAPQK